MPVEGEHASERVPLTPDAFIGREDFVTELVSLLPEARLLTLTGTGGVGKTRLAAQVAVASQAAFPDGVRWVDLDTLVDGELLPHRVAAGCGVAIPGGMAVADALAVALRHRRLLLVLDNCEHLLPAPASLVATLLAACPDLHVLATSRELLAIPGEVSWLVAPLSVPTREQVTPEDVLTSEAVQLLVARASASVPGFSITPDNAASVASICRQLEGLPLALELAAARLQLLSPQELAERLDSAAQVLGQAGRTAPARHRTLRATLDWSHRLLAEDERVIFARLSVFSGTFSLAAAEQVCAGPRLVAPGVLAALGRLVDTSLLAVHDRSGETRYRLLEPVRQYAAERLAEAGDAEDVYRRHRDWYADLAKRASAALSGPEQGRWLDRLESEHDNFGVALGWSLKRGDVAGAGRLAASIWTFWLMRGYVHEGRHWLARILASLLEPTALRAHLLWIASILGRPHMEEGRRRLEESRQIWRALGDVEGEARVLSTLGFLEQSMGNHEGAVARLEESLALLRHPADPATRGRVLTGLALSTLAMGESERASRHAREARELFRALGDDGGEAAATANLGIVCRTLGDDSQAATLWAESLAVRRRIGDRGGIAHVLALLGDLAARQNNQALAIERYRESLAVCRRSGDEHTIAAVCEGMTAVAMGTGEARAAVRFAGAAAAIRAGCREAALPWERAAHERTLRALRARLDAETLERWWHEGESAVSDQSAIEAWLAAIPASDAGEPKPSHPALIRLGTLTAREVEVLRLLTFGMTYAQIGEALFISPRTVDAHVRSIFGKLDVHSRSAATRIALEDHLV